MTVIMVNLKTGDVHTDSITTYTYTNDKGQQHKSLGFSVKAQKVCVGGVHGILTGVGRGSTINSFFKSYPHSMPPPEMKDTILMSVLNKKGTVQVITYKAVEKKRWGIFPCLEWEEEVYQRKGGWLTAGSGGQYAYAMLVSGSTPERALEVTALCDEGCGGDLQTYLMEN